MCKGGQPLGVNPVCSKTAIAPLESAEVIFTSRTFMVTPFIFRCRPFLDSPAFTLKPLFINKENALEKIFKGNIERAAIRNLPLFIVKVFNYFTWKISYQVVLKIFLHLF